METESLIHQRYAPANMECAHFIAAELIDQWIELLQQESPKDGEGTLPTSPQDGLTIGLAMLQIQKDLAECLLSTSDRITMKGPPMDDANAQGRIPVHVSIPGGPSVSLSIVTTILKQLPLKQHTGIWRLLLGRGTSNPLSYNPHEEWNG